MKLDKCEKAYEVLQTTNYDLFSFIKSNRDVSRNHVKELKGQINDGYEMPPIIVRETGEILDGQHRFVALSELGKPIQFLIKNDIKKDTLQKSNSVVSKWTIMDHIDYFRKEGNVNYQELKDFINYSELNTRMAALLLGRFKGRGGVTNGIKNGSFYVTSKDDAYQFVDEILMRIRMENPTAKILFAIRKIYNLAVDNKLLVNVINALEEELVLLNQETKIAERIVNLYNKKCPKEEKIKISYDKSGKPVYKL